MLLVSGAWGGSRFRWGHGMKAPWRDSYSSRGGSGYSFLSAMWGYRKRRQQSASRTRALTVTQPMATLNWDFFGVRTWSNRRLWSELISQWYFKITTRMKTKFIHLRKNRCLFLLIHGMWWQRYMIVYMLVCAYIYVYFYWSHLLLLL